MIGDMPSLADVVDLLHSWYPPATADSSDAVGLVTGDPLAEVARVMFAVDPTIEVAREAVEWAADLLVVHHPLFLTPVSSVAATTPKGRTLHTLMSGGCALLTAHTNADRAASGVSESLALALGMRDLSPIRSTPGDAGTGTGTGRVGTIDEMSLDQLAALVAEVLPTTTHGVRVAGERDRPVRRVAVCGGSGDFLLDELVDSDVDVFVTSDLRHHPAAEFLEKQGPALVDVPHWAAEWTWLPVVRARLRAALGDTVESRVSEIVTDPWRTRL